MSEARACVSNDGGFRAAHAAGEDWARVVKACADALGEVPEEATLGFFTQPTRWPTIWGRS